MMEIERKILGINKRELILSISKLKPKAQKLFEGLVRVKYFDFPDGRIRKKKDLLRVRELAQKGQLPRVELVYKIYKGVKHGCKYFEELEMSVEGKGQFALLSDFLKALGFVNTLYYEKKRTHFAYKNVKFEIDEHPRIPPFVEIEASSPRAIDAAITLLGLEKFESTSETIQELLTRKYKSIKLNGLVFKGR